MEPPAQPCAAEAAWRHRVLVEEIKRKGCVQTAAVEAALCAVPRHLFVPHVPLEEAYGDRVISTKYIGDQLVSSASQPAMVALMLEQLALEPGQRVLEVGTGSGYNAALMAHLVGDAGQVISVELELDLSEGAKRHLAAAGFPHVRVVCGDGAAGYAKAAPYDRIIITASARDVVPAWWDQLAPGGRLVAPFAVCPGLQASLAFAYRDHHLESCSAKPCMFMDLRGDAASQERCERVGPHLSLFAAGGATADSQAVHALLEGPYKDWGSGVYFHGRDPAGVMALRMWLALQETELITILVEGPRRQAHYLDFFEQYALSDGLLAQGALALLWRLPRALWDRSFEAVVRGYGTADRLARRLLDGVQRWQAAGRPQLDDYGIKAYRRHLAPALAEREALLARPWTDFVFAW